MPHSRPRRWTRDGILDFEWTPYETLEKLVQAPALRARVERTASVFGQGREAYHALRLPWRKGVFLYGPSGSGKTAASRALALRLGWEHLTIPAHEILDAHLLERALAAAAHPHRVIVLEDVDQVVRRMETETFFALLDHGMERAEGAFWVATTRHPEHAPKTQLVRPGRFDESLRLEWPGSGVRKEMLISDLVAPFFSTVSEDEEKLVTELVERTEGLSYAHFEELRALAATLKLEGRETELWEQARGYIGDQMIAGDRGGGLSESTTALELRLQQVDSRVLQASLDMSDVLRGLMDKVIGDAAEKARAVERGP